MMRARFVRVGFFVPSLPPPAQEMVIDLFSGDDVLMWALNTRPPAMQAYVVELRDREMVDSSIVIQKFKASSRYADLHMKDYGRKRGHE